MQYDYTRESQVRAAFWQGWQGCAKPRRNADGDYPCDVRCEFVDFVDMLQKNGHISENLAQRVTL